MNNRNPYKNVRDALVCSFLVTLLVAGEAFAANNVTGAWLSPAQDNWPLIPIHAALTPDGRVLTYGTKGDGTQTGFFIYDVWNPSSGLSNGHMTLDNMTQTDLFCSAQVIDPNNGRVFITGGDLWTGTKTKNNGNNNSNTFKYQDNTLTRGPDMYRPRWYATTTVLPNGEIYIQGGEGGADRPEVRKVDGTFRLLSNVDTSGLNWYYPRNWLAPNGKVFGYDAGGNMYYVDPSGTGQMTSLGKFSSTYAGKTSSAAMFLPGKILQFGGNSNKSLVIDIRGSSPVTTPSKTMSSKRMWVTGTILADGRVLATGGSEVANELTGVNNAAEIWDPATGKWTLGKSGSRPRLYHSHGLLLPDATVLVGGGGAPGPLTNLHAEIYYPPYLYNANDGFRPRPKILDAPSVIDIGGSFSVVSDSSTIQRVTLVKMGAVTHSVNMDQRFLELSFTQSSTTSFVQAPASLNDAPPGYYLLFVINDKKVPSVASIVRINVEGGGGGSDPPPTQGEDETTTVGGTGGNPFTLSCNASEAMVGIYGRANSTGVKQVGLRCVSIDASGHWSGDPVDRGSTGGTAGSAFSQTCPQDFAASGFTSYANSTVNRLRIECKALDGSGKVTGPAQNLTWVGSKDGTLGGPYRCSSKHPGFGLAGRSSALLDALKMQCRAAP
jgi:hypothetical protein